MLLKTAGKKAFLTVLVAGSLTIGAAAGQALAAGSAVQIAGQTVFVNNAGANGMSAEQTTQDIQNKLNDALVAANDKSPSSVKIVYYQGLPVITLGGYQVSIVNEENARQAGTTPAVLAQRWADGLRQALSNPQAVSAYLAQLTGNTNSGMPAAAPPMYPSGANVPTGNYGYNQQPNYGNQPSYAGPGQFGNAPPQFGYQQGRVVYAPAGLTLQVTLETSISTQVAKAGDLVQAQISQDVPLGAGSIPAGSVVTGQVTEALPGRMMSRSGALQIQFNSLRTPDGVTTPISAHIIGGIGKYEDGNGLMRGEGMGAKAGMIGLRGALGAGTGAALGTAVGAIAGGGHGAGTGAWSGTAIGGGVGLLEGVFLRKGRNVTIPSGTSMQLQLDSPVTIGGGQQYSQGPSTYGNL